MGLDSFLIVEIELEERTLDGAAPDAPYQAVVAAAGLAAMPDGDGLGFVTVAKVVAYWRNAYPIHEWLPALPYSSHEVGRQQLEQLRGLVTEARRTGAKLVPLGQHEGTTYYSDASYWFHLERTEEYLEAILRTLPDDARIRYEFS